MMSRVGARDGRAEVLLRSLLWRSGYRFRVQAKGLLGRPDLVFKRYRVVVFVDGDFWHGRVLREGGEAELQHVIRGEKFPWWRDKLARNVSRDDEVTAGLRRTGWHVVRVWESEVLADPQGVTRRVTRVLERRKPSVHTVRKKARRLR